MNRIDFIKKMGAATLIPILPSKTNDRMDCEIMLITSEDPVVNNIRVIPVLQERSDISRIDASYIQWLAISGLPDNYDKYEVSVRRNHETLWAQTYNYGLPREMTIEVL